MKREFLISYHLIYLDKTKIKIILKKKHFNFKGRFL